MERFEDKVPPQDLDAERSVLGSILIDNAWLPVVIHHLDTADFYMDSHRRIYESMLELFSKNTPADLITVSDVLRKKKVFDEVGGSGYLATLMDGVSVASHAEHYAEIVKAKALLRNLIRACHEIIAKSYENAEEGEEVLDWAEAQIFGIAQRIIKTGFTSIQEIMEHSFDVIEEMYKRKGQPPGLSTGFSDLNKLTGGLHPQEYVVIAGRPGMGKTSFGLNIACHVAKAEKRPVAIFSFEMSKDELMKRLLCSEGKVNHEKLRQGYIGERDWEGLTNAAARLAEAPVYIDDTASLSVLEVKARARRLQAEKGLALVVIDYLQMMPGRGNRVESRQQELAEISRALKIMSKELNVPVIALSQLSRESEKRKGDDKRPVLSDIRDSGAIEQDADLVLFIYRKDYYDRESADSTNIAEIIIGKQRHGPLGTVKLVFQGTYTRFENLTLRDEAPI